MNFNIPNLEGKIDAESIDNWVQQLDSYYSMNQLSEEENITISSLKMSTFAHCWWENLSTKMEEKENPIDTWVKFVEYVRKEFYPPKYLEQQYKKWKKIRKWKDQSVQSYTYEFHRLMDRLGVQEEEKFLVLEYINSLSPYIQQEMDFLAFNTLVDEFHYANKIEAKQKDKAHFVNKKIGRTSAKKSSADYD